MLPFWFVATQTFRAPDELLAEMRSAVASESRPRIAALFENPDRDAKYLFEMATSRGGFGKVKVCLIPSPPGWNGYGSYWAVFHAIQTIEEDHDPVYAVENTPNGLKLEGEVPEFDTGGYRIAKQDYKATLYPERSLIEVSDRLWLKSGGRPQCPVFRLNDCYRFAPRDMVTETDDRFVDPPKGSLVRAGGLLIPWTDHPSSEYKFEYSGELRSGDDDEIVGNAAYVTAWWLPSTGRLPFTVHASIDAPADWTVRAEGFARPVIRLGQRKISAFDCNLPISYPKVIGGKYLKVASAVSKKGETFAIFQLPPTDAALAAKDLKRTMDAAAFYRKVLAPLPFRGYECFSADRYYGIESYSYTLLRHDVTHFISHEMGHTYFGGMAPCPYVEDSWNEGVTQYIDSVVFQQNADHSLQNGLRTLDTPVPLSRMPIPWAFNGATYWRGCYVMKMLESEIGKDKVLAALQAIATTRQGLDTCWRDLRPYFEKAGGKDLAWFWAQWIDGATFPTLSIQSVGTRQTAAGTRTIVKVAQTGTVTPFDIRFALESGTWQQVVSLKTASTEIVLNRPIKPTDLHIQVFPFTLAKVSATPDSETVRPRQELRKY